VYVSDCRGKNYRPDAPEAPPHALSCRDDARHVFCWFGFSPREAPFPNQEIQMNNDIAEGKWKQMIGKAKSAWGELTDDELTKAEGRADRLAGLIQERYGKTRDEAELEVRRFLEANRDFPDR
jgi:uncharacterized protein YjbJ (UPF0337 family)